MLFYPVSYDLASLHTCLTFVVSLIFHPKLTSLKATNYIKNMTWFQCQMLKHFIDTQNRTDIFIISTTQVVMFFLNI